MTERDGGSGGARDEAVRALAHLRLALDAAGLGTFRWDIAGGTVEWDARMEELFGYRPGTFEGTYEAYVDRIHPEDRELVGTCIDHAVRNRKSYRIEHRIVLATGGERWLEGAGSPTVGPDGEVTGLIGCAHDITEEVASRIDRERLAEEAIEAAERERQQRERLELVAAADAEMASLARELSGAQDLQQAITVMTEHTGRAAGAGSGDVCLVEGASSLRCHRSAGPAEGVAVDLEDASPITEAVRTGLTVVRAGDETPGSIRCVAAPLFDDTHDILGVLVFEWPHVGPVDDLELAVIETIARLCGNTLRRTMAAERVEHLGGLAARLASARTMREVARHVRDHGESAFGASLVNLRVVDNDSGSLQTVLPTTMPAVLGNRFDVVRLDAPYPLTEAVRTGEPVWIADPDDYDVRYPEVAADARAAGFLASAALPLRFSDGSVAGVVALAWSHPMRFTATLRSTLATTAGLAAQTLERVTLHEAEHAVVTSLQRRLLTPLPDVDGIDLAAAYEPAVGALGMGGDWYEAFALPDGSLVAVLGDVVGHGVAAVAAMAQLQHLAAGLLKSGAPLHEVLAQTSSMLAGPDPIYATAQLLHVDPAQGVIGYQNAGHPWALLRRPDGSIELLDKRHHGMLGTPLVAAPLDYVDVPPGSLLLSYTDGLIERRNEAITDSIDRLGRLLAEADPAAPLEDSLGAIIVAARDHEPDEATNDDIAALLIRVT